LQATNNKHQRRLNGACIPSLKQGMSNLESDRILHESDLPEDLTARTIEHHSESNLLEEDIINRAKCGTFESQTQTKDMKNNRADVTIM